MASPPLSNAGSRYHKRVDISCPVGLSAFCNLFVKFLSVSRGCRTHSGLSNEWVFTRWNAARRRSRLPGAPFKQSLSRSFRDEGRDERFEGITQSRPKRDLNRASTSRNPDIKPPCAPTRYLRNGGFTPCFRHCPQRVVGSPNLKARRVAVMIAQDGAQRNPG